MKSITVSGVEARYDKILLRVVTSQGDGFIIVITEGGFEFYSGETSARNPTGKAVIKTIDDLLNWIRNDGDRVKFGNRKGLKQLGARFATAFSK